MNSSGSQTSNSLRLLCGMSCAGDHEASATLLDSLRNRFTSILKCVLRIPPHQEMDRQDRIQDWFVTVLGNDRKILCEAANLPTEDQVRGQMCGILRKATLKWIEREYERRPNALEIDVSTTEIDQPSPKVPVDELLNLKGLLSPDECVVLNVAHERLECGPGFTWKGVADSIGVSQGVVSGMIRRIRERKGMHNGPV